MARRVGQGIKQARRFDNVVNAVAESPSLEAAGLGGVYSRLSFTTIDSRRIPLSR